MRDQYLAQAKQNQEFLKTIISAEQDKYFDWKVTVSFYIVIHWVKAYLFPKYGVVKSHDEIAKIISPYRNQSSPISSGAKNLYMTLLNSSRSCRYNGFDNLEAFNKHTKQEFAIATEALNKLEAYFVSLKLFD
jgi:hypothetical protein